MLWVNAIPQPGDVIILELGAVLGCTSIGGVVFNVPPVIN